ncbi:non-specific lipid transfer protein GPI-anchored 16-like [Rhodamnia argentea]|uniref:Non-specific lipid transfer protein GPI-anchored 16-like n=1 Tax=Rhodamnia argentea TaxID=178133 RepID=A0A8B8P4G5_9MYRT|nr:non-specific lipid transfer protein GPI-anchored 16-like [Rhodamnia argentea]
MEGTKAFLELALVMASALCAITPLPPVGAQISTPCSASMISSFTPCFNFITGSSAKGGSPSSDCCNSFKSLLQSSLDCTCLVVTANIPIPLPINRSLVLSLPQACNGGLPLQCKASGSPLPAPGPVMFGPTHAPAASSPHHHEAVSGSPHVAPSPSFSSRASKAVAASPPTLAPESDTTSDEAPAYSPGGSVGPSRTPGVRPVLNPFSSASSPAHLSLPSLVLIFVGAVVFKSD